MQSFIDLIFIGTPMPGKFQSRKRLRDACKSVNSREIFDILTTAIALDTLDD